MKFKNTAKTRLIAAVEAASMKHDSAMVTGLTHNQVVVRSVVPQLKADLVFEIWNTAKGLQLKAAVREHDSKDKLVFLRGKPLRNRIMRDYPASAPKLIAFLNTVV